MINQYPKGNNIVSGRKKLLSNQERASLGWPKNLLSDINIVVGLPMLNRGSVVSENASQILDRIVEELPQERQAYIAGIYQSDYTMEEYANKLGIDPVALRMIRNNSVRTIAMKYCQMSAPEPSDKLKKRCNLDVLDKDISYLRFSVRLEHALRRSCGINTVGALCACKASELRQINGIGETYIQDILCSLYACGLSLAQEEALAKRNIPGVTSWTESVYMNIFAEMPKEFPKEKEAERTLHAILLDKEYDTLYLMYHDGLNMSVIARRQNFSRENVRLVKEEAFHKLKKVKRILELGLSEYRKLYGEKKKSKAMRLRGYYSVAGTSDVSGLPISERTIEYLTAQGICSITDLIDLGDGLHDLRYMSSRRETEITKALELFGF